MPTQFKTKIKNYSQPLEFFFPPAENSSAKTAGMGSVKISIIDVRKNLYSQKGMGQNVNPLIIPHGPLIGVSLEKSKTDSEC